MIDIHCHILHDIDDGPAQLDQAVQMAAVAAADNVKTIVATPHIHSTATSPAQICQKILELNAALQQQNIPLEVVQGAEILFQMSPDSLKGYTINNSSYLLVEFPHSHFPANAAQILFNLRIKGFMPIIAHPERNPTIIKNPQILTDLLSDKIYTQLTSASVCGRFGRSVERCSRYLLENNAAHFIATDAHSPEFRRPQLSKGLQAAEKIIGKERAALLVTTNPAAVLANAPLPAHND